MRIVQFLLKNEETSRVGIENDGIFDVTEVLGVKSTLDFLKISKNFQDTAFK